MGDVLFTHRQYVILKSFYLFFIFVVVVVVVVLSSRLGVRVETATPNAIVVAARSFCWTRP